MRVTQNMLYENFINRMNSNLSELVDLNIQNASQKRINRPSDDPVGMARVLTHRTTLNGISRYKSNVDTAKGWLSLADSTLGQVSTLLNRARELASQASSGTYSAENRIQIGYEVRQLFNQMVSLANTSYEGKGIFAGHKVDGNAFDQSLMVTASGAGLGPYLESVSGGSSTSVLVQFVGSGAGSILGQDTVAYRFSRDGGKSWSPQATLPGVGSGAALPAVMTLDLNGVKLNLRSGFTVKPSATSNTDVATGTWIKVVPTATYNGDEENDAAAEILSDPSNAMRITARGGFERDVRIKVTGVGPGDRIDYAYTAGGITCNFANNGKTLNLPEGQIELNGDVQAGLEFTVRSGAKVVDQLGGTVNAWGEGVFSKNMVVRLDNTTNLGSGADIQYSYSQDGGQTWKSGNTAPNPATGMVRLVVPGGSLALTAKPGPTGNVLTQGQQFIIHPETAGIEVSISETEKIRINSIGKDVFGGMYDKGTDPVFQNDPKRNLFVSFGKLVGALETNSQSEAQQALEQLKESQKQILNASASVGGRENRLDAASEVMAQFELDENERLGKVEDVDVHELLTKLAQRETSYQAVLKSSSMIMRLSLVNYL